MKVWIIALLAILAGEASAKWYDALKVPADQWPGYFYKEIKPSATGLPITIGTCSSRCQSDADCNAFVVKDDNCYLGSPEKTESLLSAASDPLGVFIKEDYATNLSNSSYTKNAGVVSSSWTKHIFESVVLPRPSVDFCKYLCNTSKSTCEIAVLDANKCLMGNLSYTDGNPTLIESTWNVDIQADIQLSNYNTSDIEWLLNILGPDMMYAKAQVWESRWRTWIFEIVTSETTEEECARRCYFYYTSQNPCEVYSFDIVTDKCYIGNMATNMNNITVPEQISDVWFEPDVISTVVDTVYLEEASVAGATWSPWMNEQIDLAHISDAKVQLATCKALCYFRIHICYLYVLEGNYCYLGDPDAKNTVASSSNSQNVYRRDGKFLINVGSSDSSYYRYVEMFAVGSGSSLSGCGSPEQFPLDIFYNAVGYMNDETVMSCGGYDPHKSTGKYTRDTCYKYTPKTNKWEQTSGTMKIDRGHGGYDNHPNWGLVMVGGLSWISEAWVERSDGEYTFDGVTFNDLPDMSTTRRHACVAAIDEEWLFVAGGYNPTNPKNLITAEKFSKSGNTWQNVNNMPDHGSYHHESCGAVNMQGNIEVIIPGGHETGGGGELNRVLAFTWSTQTWRHLPTYPWGRYRVGGTAHFANTIILGGGHYFDNSDFDSRAIVMKNTEDDGWTHLGYWGAKVYYSGQTLIPFKDALYC